MDSFEEMDTAGEPTAMLQWPIYTEIEENQAVPPVIMSDTVKGIHCMSPCTCQANCGPACLNYLLKIECNDEICAIGLECQNRNFSRCLYATTEIIATQNRGWGLAAKENLHENQFVIEFVGEIVSNREMEERIEQKKMAHDHLYYFMELTSKLTLDAEHMGNKSRFLNHSCMPNCKVEIWEVQGALRVGIFTKENIQEGTELTLDYMWRNQGDDVMNCFCGAPNCSGIMGNNWSI